MIDQDEANELRRQVACERRSTRRLAAHPDPRDPDYPHAEQAPRHVLAGGRQHGKTAAYLAILAAHKAAAEKK